MISIFAKEAFLNINPHEPFKNRTKPVPEGKGHLQRVSSMIRGDQIADEIGCRFNPENGFENDVCIYVKPMVRKGDDFKFEGRKNYIDIIDGHNLSQVAAKHPEVGVITCSQADYELMGKEISNEIVLIPQHHCNFDREIRYREGIRTMGIIGVEKAFEFLPRSLEEDLAKRKINLLKFSRFFSRQDIIDFYKNIDIQIVWRPYKKILSNPLKIVNAMSFGVPTIALDEKAFHELGDSYIPVSDFNEFLMRLDELRNDSDLYYEYVQKGFKVSERYHISKVGKLYKQLDK